MTVEEVKKISEIYNLLRKVPKEAQKTITGGRLNGMTDIKPMWRIEKLTEIFGTCGFGWKTVIKNKQIIDGANDEKIAIVDIDLYVKVNDEWSEAIEGTGGSSFIAKERNGLYTNDECFKMAYTDALSVACKSLGMGADVYWGDSKYNSNDPTKEDAEAYTFAWGKYKGKKLSEVPENYLNWVLDNSNDANAIKMIELYTGQKSLTEAEKKEKLELIIQLDDLLKGNDDIRCEIYENYDIENISQLTIEELREEIKSLNG